jgi:predicted permease
MPNLDSLLHDLRVALRGLRRDLGFTSTALLTFALCLGANITLFAILNAVILRPLPYPNPDQLVTVYNSYPKAGVERAGASVPHFIERRAGIGAFTEAAALREEAVTMGEAGNMDRVKSMSVTPSFFKVLGVSPALGRSFTEEEGTYGKNNVVVISDSLWRSMYAADPSVIGRKLRLNSDWNVEVIGVMPPGYDFGSAKTRIWTPMCFNDEDKQQDRRHSNNMNMIARLKPGTTLGEARAQVDALNKQASSLDPYASLVADAGFTTKVEDLHTDMVAEAKPILLLLQAGVLCLLLIGAVNLANLLLVRAISRTKEVSIRRVLGASAAVLVRQVLCEILVLSILGAVLGLGFGYLGLQGMELLGSEQLPHSGNFSLDAVVCAASLAGAVVVGLLLAVPVLWHNLRGNLASSLSVESRGGTTTKATHRVRHGLIVVQFALAFVLLNGAGLLGLSFLHVNQVKPGFEPAQVHTALVPLPYGKYKEVKDRVAFLNRLEQEIKAMPGIEAFGFGSTLPFTDNVSQNGISIEGRPPKEGETLQAHYFSGVSGDFFRTLGIPLKQGRLITSDDTNRGDHVCVIDEDVARRYWPEGDSIGHRLFNGPPRDEKDAYTVVGVVGAVKQRDLADNKHTGAIYVTYEQYASLQIALVVKSSQPAENLAKMLRQGLQRLDPELPLDQFKPLHLLIDESLRMRKAPFILTLLFASVALLLAGIGLYGVLAYSVAQRRREIGIRMALGALPEQLRSQFLMLGLRLVLGGALLGLVGAYFGAKAMASQLFGVSTMDPVILGSVGVLLSAISITACLRPSSQAAQVAPWAALKAD